MLTQNSDLSDLPCWYIDGILWRAERLRNLCGGVFYEQFVLVENEPCKKWIKTYDRLYSKKSEVKIVISFFERYKLVLKIRRST